MYPTKITAQLCKKKLPSQFQQKENNNKNYQVKIHPNIKKILQYHIHMAYKVES
jgi:hypothetical protein